MNTHDRTDHESADGAQQEFAEFYRSELRPLVGYLVMVGSSVEQAADIAQEVMVELYTNWRVVTNPRAWMRVVAMRLLRRSAIRERALRKAAEQQAGSEREPAAVADVRPGNLMSEQAQLVMAALRGLPPSQREVLALTVDGFPPGEIAEILGKSTATVRSNLRHARDHMREKLTAAGIDVKD